MVLAMKTTSERGSACTERQNWATLISPRCAGQVMSVILNQAPTGCTQIPPLGVAHLKGYPHEV